MSNYQKLSTGVSRQSGVQGTDIVSGAATAVQFLAANGSTGSSFRSIVSGDLPVIPETKGGTNQSSYALGDTLYASATNTLSKLAGNTTAVLNVLTQTGTGSVSAAPVWTATTGTGNVVMSISPVLTGTINAASQTLSGTLGVTGNTTMGTAGSAVTGFTERLKVWGGDGISAIPANAGTGYGIYTTDYNNSSTGTYLRIGLGATAGSTSTRIQAKSAGGTAVAQLELDANVLVDNLLTVTGVSQFAGAQFTDAGAGAFTGANRARILNSGGQTFIDTLGSGTGTYGTYTIRQLSSDVSLNRTILSADTGGNWGMGAAPVSAFRLDITGNGTSGARNTRLQSSDTTTTFNSVAGMLVLKNTSATNNNFAFLKFADANNNQDAGIGAVFEDHNDKISLVFQTSGAAGAGAGEKMRIDSTGAITALGTLALNTGASQLSIGGALNTGAKVAVNGTDSAITAGSSVGFKSIYTANANNTSNVIGFLAGNTTGAGITLIRTINFESDAPTKGAGTTLSNHIDFLAGGASSHVGTNNSALTDTTTISGNTFLFQAGSDPSVLTGQLSLGTATANQFLTVNGGATRTPVSFKGSTGAGAGYLYYDGSSSGIKTEAGSFTAGTVFIGVDTSSGVLGYTNNTLRFQISTAGLTTFKQTAAAAEAATLDFEEKDTTPSNPASGTEVKFYMKSDKIIFQYNDAGTVRYKYLDLTGTGVTWTHTTTAP